jgi:drug/metabolite transporter (DMT)-like permease
MQTSDNIKGAILMCLSMAGFAFNDATLKYAASEMSIFQAMFVRGCFATFLLFVLAAMRGGFANPIARRDLGRIGLRGLAEVAATLCFLTALFNVPIANITAILQALPLAITLAAALFLGERFGLQRGLAILVGLIGVIIIIRPGSDGFNSYSVLGIFAVFFIVARDLLVRRLSHNVPTIFVAFAASVIITVAGALGTLWQWQWVAVDQRTLLLLILAAVFLAVGYFFSIATMRVGEVAFVTPFRYTIMVWAILMGWLLFDELPDGWTVFGTAIVITMGLFTLWREARLKS